MRICLFLLSVLFCASCTAPGGNVPVKTGDGPGFNYGRLEGYYAGTFGGEDMRIALTHVTGRHAIGYNLFKGQRRNMSGSMAAAGNGFAFKLNEPGDGVYDGTFTFSIDTNTLELKGTWAALNNKAVKEKTYTFTKVNDSLEFVIGDNNVWTDSIGSCNLNVNGTCVYEAYPVKDGVVAQQMVRINGTWALKDSVYTISWEANDIFPSRKTVFIKRDITRIDTNADGTVENYSDRVLEGEGRVLRPVMY